MFEAHDLLGNSDGLSARGKAVIGDCLAQITAVLMTEDPNFLQGNPAAFDVPTDVKDVTITAVISLKGRSIRPRIARVRD